MGETIRDRAKAFIAKRWMTNPNESWTDVAVDFAEAETARLKAAARALVEAIAAEWHDGECGGLAACDALATLRKEMDA